MAKSFGDALKESGPVVLMHRDRVGGIPEVILVPGKELQALELLGKLGVIKISLITDDKVLSCTSTEEVKEVVNDEKIQVRAARCRKRMRR